MESPRIMAWRWEFLRKIRKLKAEGDTPMYLDETWFDSHETMSRLLSDGSKSCSLRGPVSRGKRIVIAHAGTSNGFGSLYLVAYFYVEKIIGCVCRLSSGYECKRF